MEGESSPMTIEIHTPELEQRVQQGIQSGRFQDVDDLLTRALDALDEKQPLPPPRRLIDVLSDPAFAGAELNVERRKDFPRPVDRSKRRGTFYHRIGARRNPLRHRTARTGKTPIGPAAVVRA
jgi:hypothetical protein